VSKSSIVERGRRRKPRQRFLIKPSSHGNRTCYGLHSRHPATGFSYWTSMDCPCSGIHVSWRCWEVPVFACDDTKPLRVVSRNLFAFAGAICNAGLTGEFTRPWRTDGIDTPLFEWQDNRALVYGMPGWRHSQRSDMVLQGRHRARSGPNKPESSRAGGCAHRQKARNCLL